MTEKKPGDVTLYGYQAVKIDSALRHICAGRDVILEEPTGSGKTLQGIVILVLSMAIRRVLSHAIVIAPQRQIEEGFLGRNGSMIRWPDGAARSRPIRIPDGFVRAARDGDRGSVQEILAYLANPDPGYVMATTHGAMTYLLRHHRDQLPASLARMMLFVDEAHHAPAKGLSAFADEWAARGGRIAYATATPYRANGVAVRREGMVSLRRCQAEHMEEGYAPARVANEIVAYGRKGDKVTGGEFSGEVLTKNRSRQSEIAGAMVSKWIEDGRPKLIVRVPPAKGGSGPLVALLLKHFHRAGARVLSLAGVGRNRQQQVIEALREEQARDGFAGSQYDVMIGVQRVTEGTDWPVCSHVYCLGIPGSLGAVIQLLGRAMRKKQADHPLRDLAKIAFFVPCAGGDALENLAIEHSRHALLTCVFMADYETGEEWIVTQEVRKGLGLKSGADEESDVDEALAVPADVYAEAKLHMAIAEEANPGITIGSLIDVVRKAMPNASPDHIANVVFRRSAGDSGPAGKRIQKAIQSGTREYIEVKPTITEALKATFDGLVERFRNETLTPSVSLNALATQVHVVTGGGMRGLTERLRNASGAPLTIKGIVNWIRTWREENKKNPTVLSGNIPGTDETWAGIDQALSKGSRGLAGGSSLAKLIEQVFGDRNMASLPTLSRKVLSKWVSDWRKSNNGKYPNKNSGAIPGTNGETWANINAAIVDERRGLVGYRSLADFVHREFGARLRYRLPDLSVPGIVVWLESHWQIEGEFPSRNSGDIPGTDGETWGSVFSAAHNGRRGLTRGYGVTRIIEDYFPGRPSRASTAAAGRWSRQKTTESRFMPPTIATPNGDPQ